MKVVTTLVHLLRDDAICLAIKKRGFGAGNWNGYGGKIEGGETIELSAVRETWEESGVVVNESALEENGIIDFFFKDGRHIEVHSFFVRSWEGDPVETEEMKPEWFAFDKIPYENMWADDSYWIPRALRGEKLNGRVWFNEDGKTIEQMEWKSVGSL
jgi:8-oxo-dGTP pyrophosphatase MutT (NUDIX family)